MQRTHVAGFDLNERLLYHTSRASTETICAEGLDQRLGGMGNFGRGIYFRCVVYNTEMMRKIISKTIS